MRKGERATLAVFWKFSHDAAETDDGEKATRNGSHLLFTRGYSVFNCNQVDGYTPNVDATLDGPARIEQADAFFGASLQIVIREVQTFLALFVFSPLRFFRSIRRRRGCRAHRSPCPTLRTFAHRALPLTAGSSNPSEPTVSSNRPRSEKTLGHSCDAVVPAHRLVGARLKRLAFVRRHRWHQDQIPREQAAHLQAGG